MVFLQTICVLVVSEEALALSRSLIQGIPSMALCGKKCMNVYVIQRIINNTRIVPALVFIAPVFSLYRNVCKIVQAVNTQCYTRYRPQIFAYRSQSNGHNLIKLGRDIAILIVCAICVFQESREWKGEREELAAHGKSSRNDYMTFQSTLNMYYLG